MTFEKKEVFTIDTSKERKRISKAFRSKYHKETKKKLTKLMDLIEGQEWEKAMEELCGKWWKGYDEKGEHPRLEFVGMLNKVESGRWVTYTDLVMWMYDKHSKCEYKVIKMEK